MRKNTIQREEQVGLLDPEHADAVFRPQRHAETVDIPDPIYEETAPEELEEPFLRARKRVPVRRRGAARFTSRFAWKNRWVQATVGILIVAGIGLLAAAALELKSIALHNPHFFLASDENIQVVGNRVVTTPQVLTVFIPDIGRSVVRVPLAGRQAELEQIHWVRLATVMRLWPNRLRVNIVERSPIAFAREGNSIRLVDDDGVLLDLPDGAAQHYSFPILTGISASDPRSTRAARIQIFQNFSRALDADGGHISNTLSEVDLSDPEDVRAIFSGSGKQPLVHFGDTDFLPRYRNYESHLTEWLQQYPQLRSVDLRYGKQVVLDTGTTENAPLPSEIHDTTQPSATAANEADSQKKISISKTAAVKSKTRTGTAKKHATAQHHARVHKHGKASKSQRGHPVRKPLMHVVSGA